MSECQKERWRGQCCCNCAHQIEVRKHPWNEGTAKGSVMERMGFACKGLSHEPGSDAQMIVVYSDREHSMCEMWERRIEIHQG